MKICAKEERLILNFEDVIVKKSDIGQFEDGLGVFANRDFKKGEVVVKWNLKVLTQEEYVEALSPKGERFLIHSSQLKGSSNRLLPVLPAAS